LERNEERGWVKLGFTGQPEKGQAKAEERIGMPEKKKRRVKNHLLLNSWERGGSAERKLLNGEKKVGRTPR